MSSSFIFYCFFLLLFCPINGSITILSNHYSESEYNGPTAVVKSLRNGFTKLGIVFNWNPPCSEYNDTVIVLSNINYLKNAIALKKEGKIKKILAGPNLVNRIYQFGGILASKEIDRCIVSCNWLRNIYESDDASLIGRTSIWFAGIDPEVWLPNKSNLDSKKVLIYWKTENDNFYAAVEHIVRVAGWQPITLRYNHFKQNDFKELVNECAFAIFISRSETQGIALLECWAMDCPTLVWNPKTALVDGQLFPSSSSPYLSQKTGREWQNFNELQNLIGDIDEIMKTTSPRSWVLENMTDNISAKLMLSIVDSIY